MQAAVPKIELSADWLVGEGIALTMIDTVPPDGHIADARISLRDDGGFELTVGTAEFGNGTSTVHRQIAATALATTVDQIRLLQSDTAHGGHDTGAYGITGTFVAGRATQGGGGNIWPTRSRCLRPLRPGQIRTLACWRTIRVVCGEQRISVRPARRSGARARTDADGDRHVGGHAALGRFQCAGLSGRGEQGHRRNQDS